MAFTKRNAQGVKEGGGEGRWGSVTKKFEFFPRR